MGKVATKAQREAAVAACGKYYGSQRPGYNPGIKIQERLHRAMVKHLEKFNPDHHTKLMELAEDWWNKKLMKGPGIDW